MVLKAEHSGPSETLTWCQRLHFPLTVKQHVFFLTNQEAPLWHPRTHWSNQSRSLGVQQVLLVVLGERFKRFCCSEIWFGFWVVLLVILRHSSRLCGGSRGFWWWLLVVLGVFLCGSFDFYGYFMLVQVALFKGCSFHFSSSGSIEGLKNL